MSRIIGDHFWDLLLPHYSVAFVTLCEKAISQQIWRVVPTTDVAARFLIRLKVVQKRKENGFYWWWCSESSFTYPAALLSSLSSLFWFSGFLRPQNWTLEIWTVLRLMCNEVVSKVNGGGSQGDLTGLQSQGNPQPMHLPRLQRDQPHWRQYTLDSQKTISKLWTLRHLLSAFWTSARIQKNIPLALLFCGSKKLPGGFFLVSGNDHYGCSKELKYYGAYTQNRSDPFHMFLLLLHTQKWVPATDRCSNGSAVLYAPVRYTYTYSNGRTSNLWAASSPNSCFRGSNREQMLQISISNFTSYNFKACEKMKNSNLLFLKGG